jgi:hypothetical protein
MCTFAVSASLSIHGLKTSGWCGSMHAVRPERRIDLRGQPEAAIVS